MTTLTSADGTTIGYETVGSGPVVILVDGAMCFRDAGPMRPIADRLADRFRVVLYDRRGRGASTDTAPFAVGREIEDIDALISAVGSPAVGLGISSGAMLLLRAAAALGRERIAGVALYEPPLMPEAARAGAAAYTAELTAALARGDQEGAVELFVRRVGMPEEAIAGMRGTPMWAGMVRIAPTLAYDDAAMGDSSVPDALVHALRTPTLTLAGGASPDFLRFGAQALADAILDAQFAVVEGQTHDVDAAAIDLHLRPFFENAGAAAADRRG